jgi:hypothetical protein
VFTSRVVNYRTHNCKSSISQRELSAVSLMLLHNKFRRVRVLLSLRAKGEQTLRLLIVLLDSERSLSLDFYYAPYSYIVSQSPCLVGDLTRSTAACQLVTVRGRL